MIVTGSKRWRSFRITAIHELGHIFSSAGTATDLIIEPHDTLSGARGETLFDREVPDTLMISRLYGGRLAEELLGVFVDDGTDGDDRRRIAGIAKIAGYRDYHLAAIRRMTARALRPFLQTIDIRADDLARLGPGRYHVEWRNTHDFELRRVRMH